MSLFGDAQEFPAFVLTELDVEMFALNLQFSRLDNVIHFLPEAADSNASILENGRKIGRIYAKFFRVWDAVEPMVANRVLTFSKADGQISQRH
jgi:hypothetical protein